MACDVRAPGAVIYQSYSHDDRLSRGSRRDGCGQRVRRRPCCVPAAGDLLQESALGEQDRFNVPAFCALRESACSKRCQLRLRGAARFARDDPDSDAEARESRVSGSRAEELVEGERD